MKRKLQKNCEKANEKIMNKVLAILKERSMKAHELSRKQLSTIKIESPKAREALEYYIKNWDDITHPGILSLACEAVGGKLETAIPMQAVMLLLSAAVDVHDDIIDQSKFKNGKPTVFCKFGKETALLIGDALFLKGFIFLYEQSNRFPSETMRKILATIENSFCEFGNAHLREIDFKKKLEISPNEYLRILEGKGATIEVHARIGAIIGRGSDKEIEAIGRYAKILGALIAIREDFIDIFEPVELQNRIKNECLPLPVLYTFDNPKVKETICALGSSPKNPEKLTEKLVKIVFEDKNAQKLIKIMEAFSEEALNSINQLKLKKHLKDELYLLIQGTLEDLQENAYQP